MKDGQGRDAIDKFILIGDQKQLPAVVLQPASASEVKNPLLRSIGLTNLKDSLFERLYRNSSKLTSTDRVSNPHVDMLTRQGRMHPDVARFANNAFYEGKLEPVGLPHQLDKIEQRTKFFVSTPESSTNSHKINHSEATIAAQIAASIYRQSENFDTQHTLGIITPYRSQIALIRSELAKLSISALNDITIDTVERYQGSERDVIIYSFTIQNIYQLDFLTSNSFEEKGHIIDRKLNVAITRARKQMLITGNENVLKNNQLFKKLIESIPTAAFLHE